MGLFGKCRGNKEWSQEITHYSIIAIHKKTHRKKILWEKDASNYPRMAQIYLQDYIDQYAGTLWEISLVSNDPVTGYRW